MSNENKTLFKDDVGVVIRVWAGPNVDLSSATSLTLAIMKPYGDLVTWSASVASDNNYYAVYTVVAGDLDQTGLYQVSLVANFTGCAVFTGKTDTFEVFSRYDDLVN